MTRDQVQTYARLIYPRSEPCWIALCLIAPGNERIEHRFLTVERLPHFLAYARFRNAHGWGVYITPSLLASKSRNRRKESFQPRQSVIYLDCDHAECLQCIRERYPYPTLIVRTSRGRHQVYWRLDQPVDVAQQERLMSAMAAEVGADRAATDVSRVLRLPAYWNRKPGRDNRVDIVFSRSHAVSYQSLMERAQPTLGGDMLHDSSPSTPPVGRAVLDAMQVPCRHLSGHASPSEMDWYHVHRRLALGQLPQDVVDWLKSRRSDKPDPRYYAQLTVSNAVQSRSNKFVE